jgi:hypothetical protein
MRKILVIVAVFFSIFLLYFTTSNLKKENTKFDERIEQFYQTSKAECQVNSNNCKKYEIAKLAIAGDLIQAQTIEKKLLESKLIDINQCHLISHFLGEISYYKFGLTATIKNKESGCLQGLYHGAIFQYVKNIKTNLELSEIRGICKLNNIDQQNQQICIHGIGHAFIYNKDLTHAVGKCSEVFDQRAIGVNQLNDYNSCLGGAFASELTKNINHQSKKIKLSSISTFLAGCKDLEQQAKIVCISFYGMEGLGRSEGSTNSYLTNCLAIENYELNCAQGVGMAYVNYHNIHIDTINNYCFFPVNEVIEAYPTDLRQKVLSACVEGYKSSLFLNPHLTSPLKTNI